MSKLIKLPDVIKRTTLSKSSVYAFISEGSFPKQINLGLRGVAWKNSDIEEWIEERNPTLLNF